jgi:hypothetical protein
MKLAERLPLSHVFRLLASVRVRFRLWSFMDGDLVESDFLFATAVGLRGAEQVSSDDGLRWLRAPFSLPGSSEAKNLAKSARVEPNHSRSPYRIDSRRVVESDASAA